MVRTILRSTMIYGAPGDRNLSPLFALLRWVPVLPVPGRGRRLQQTVHIADLARAVLAVVERSTAAGASYNVVRPPPLTFADLLRFSANTVGTRARLVPVPLAPFVTAARCYERLGRRPRIRAEQLGYAPRPFAGRILTEARALGMAR